MSLLLIILLLAATFACIALKRRRAVRWLHVTWIALIVAIGCGPLPGGLLGRLQSAYAVNPPVNWGKRNAIIVLGAGTERIPGGREIEPGLFAYGRLVEAAVLYRQCRQAQAYCKLVVSGGDPAGNGVTEAQVYRGVLIRLGVETADILLEPESRNTWQNAQFVRGVVTALNPERVLIVSSAVHLRRSMLYFNHFGIDATPMRADYLRGKLSVLPLSYNFAMTDLALHEYAGIARYHLYNALGLNPPRVRVPPSR
ncbi:YdcF family protein [Burkholderia alba]|uniref:YdcF family protein n=1 Tax=Burkholderia alba TaxID=2683677 RepID=UPI002B061C7A|nr:YdcF family protein [Burkholderia alba]